MSDRVRGPECLEQRGRGSGAPCHRAWLAGALTALLATMASCGGGGGTATADPTLTTSAPTITVQAPTATPATDAPAPTTPASSTAGPGTVAPPASSTAGPGTVAPPTAAPTTTTPAPTTTTPAPTTTTPAPTTLAPPPTAPVPAVDATAYAVYDATADRWLAASEADSPRAVGSLMKLLTAYVVMQAGDPAHVVTVPALGLDPMESVIGLYQGEQLPRDLLVRAMLIVSANDAAKALAIDLAGSEEAFAAQMNAAASALGLAATTAVNARGLDAPGAQSTATDMTRLAAVLLQDPTFRTTVARTDAKLHGQVFPATNGLLTSYAGAIGVKTGRTTQAGWCLVGAAERDGRTVIVTVLGASGSAARTQSAATLLDWAFATQ